LEKRLSREGRPELAEVIVNRLEFHSNWAGEVSKAGFESR
jgi:hypothetical protein